MKKSVLLPKYRVNDQSPRSLLYRKTDYIGWSQELLGLPEVWQITKGKGITVAVLDTGIDENHPDLRDAVTEIENFSDSRDAKDRDGHGTHVAGIIAGRENSRGIIGVAPECSLVIGKVLDDDGYGDYEWITEGIRWASTRANIISLSLGGPDNPNGLFQAVHEAIAKGCTIIAAAGNSGAISRNSIAYPGRYGSIITAGSHDMNGHPSGFSSVGGEIDFLAPGDEIWSSYLNNNYASLSGTSMATPFIAGLAALVLSKEKGNSEDVRNALMEMSTHPGYYDNGSGYGPLQPMGFFKKFV